MRKIKVLRTIETFYPNVTGPANQAFQISSRLEKKGIESPIATTNFRAEKSKRTEKISGVTVIRFPVRFRIMQYTVAPELKRFLEKEECDIIHAHNYRGYHTQAGFKAARKRGLPFVISTHGGLLGYEQYLKGPAKLPYILFDFVTGKKAALQADAVVVNSKKEYEDALRYGVKREKLHLIPVGIDISEYSPLPKNDKELNVLFVGRITQNRNVEPIIKAVAELRKKKPEQKIRLIIVGGEVKTSSTNKGGYLDELKNLAKELNVSDIVEFTGPKYGTELRKHYRATDIFVYTSLSENFGQTILEAGAAGLPMICTRVGIVPEIIQNGKNGFIVKGEPKEIAARITELFDKNKREAFGRKTREIVRQKFDWESIIQKYLQVYKSFAKKKN